MSALKWTTKEVDQQLNYVVDVWEDVLRNLKRTNSIFF